MQPQSAPQWREVEIALTGPGADNPYTEVDAWVIFTHDSGRVVRRPVFWDGGTTYRVRFASTQPDGVWQWSVHADRPDHELLACFRHLDRQSARPRSSTPSSESRICHSSPIRS